MDRNDCQENNENTGVCLSFDNLGVQHQRLYYNTRNADLSFMNIKIRDPSSSKYGNSSKPEKFQKFKEGKKKKAIALRRSSWLSGDVMESDLKVERNSNCFIVSSGRSGAQLWGILRSKYKLAVMTIKMRGRHFNVVKKCPVRFVFSMEVERLAKRSRLRRLAHESTWYSDWLQEEEIYQNLLNAVEQYRQIQNEEKQKKSKLSKHLFTGKIKRKALFDDIQGIFRNSCSFMNGAVGGMRRYNATSDVVRHWWIKAAFLLRDDDLSKVGQGSISSFTIGLLREETFWVFSQHYFDLDFSNHLLKYQPVDCYLSLDMLKHIEKPTVTMEAEENPSLISVQRPELETRISVQSDSRDETIETNELFSRISEPSYLEEIKTIYGESRVKESETQSLNSIQSKKEETHDEDNGQQSDDRSELQNFLFDQIAPKQSKIFAQRSISQSTQSRKSESARFSGNLDEVSEQRDRASTVVIRTTEKSTFRKRLECVRRIYPHPLSMSFDKNAGFDEDFRQLLPTENLLKSIILQLPHEKNEDAPNVRDIEDTESDPFPESMRETMKLSVSRFPPILTSILRKNSVVLDPRKVTKPRITGENDEILDSFGLSELDKIKFRQMESLQGLSVGSDKFMLKCFRPEIIGNGLAKVFPTKVNSENQSSNYLHTSTIIMLPPEEEKPENIIDLATRVMNPFVPHIREFFSSLFKRVKVDIEWMNENDAEVLGVGLTRVGHDLLRYRNIPGHSVRYKVLSIIATATNNSQLRSQLLMTAKMPNSWMDQTLRTFNSVYSSCRVEAAFIIAYVAKCRKLMKQLLSSPHCESILYDIATALMKAADLFEEDFCEIFLALSYLFHFVHHQALLEAVLDRWSTFRSVKMTSAWPLLLVFGFRYWSSFLVSRMNFGGQRLISALNSAMYNPVSRHNAKIAIDAIETASSVKTDLITGWPGANRFNDSKLSRRRTRQFTTDDNDRNGFMNYGNDDSENMMN